MVADELLVMEVLSRNSRCLGPTRNTPLGGLAKACVAYLAPDLRVRMLTGHAIDPHEHVASVLRAVHVLHDLDSKTGIDLAPSNSGREVIAWRRFEGPTSARIAIDKLLSAKCCFTATPLPDDGYEVQVRVADRPTLERC